MQGASHLICRCVSGIENKTCSVQCRPGRYLMDVAVAFSGMATGMIKALFHLMRGMQCMLLSSEQIAVPVYRHERLQVHAAPHLGYSASSRYANPVKTVSQSNRYMSPTSKPSGVRCPERSGASPPGTWMPANQESPLQLVRRKYSVCHAHVLSAPPGKPWAIMTLHAQRISAQKNSEHTSVSHSTASNSYPEGSHMQTAFTEHAGQNMSTQHHAQRWLCGLQVYSQTA